MRIVVENEYIEQKVEKNARMWKVENIAIEQSI